MIDKSVPPAPRTELFERIHQLELDDQWRERAIKVGLCIHCGYKLSIKGHMYAGHPIMARTSNGKSVLICDTCGREYYRK